MPIRILCPNSHELTVDEQFIGRKVRCPACQVVMIVPDPNPQAVTARPPAGPRAAAEIRAGAPQPRQEEPEEELEEEEDEERERVRRKKAAGKQKRLGMRRANLGLSFMYWGVLGWIVLIALYLLMLVVLPLIGIGAAAGAAAGNREGAMAAAGAGYVVGMIVGLIAQVILIATPVLGFLAGLFSLWVPAKSGGKILSLISFVFYATAVGMFVVSFFLMLTATGGGFGAAMAAAAGGGILFLLGLLAMFVGWVLYMIYVRMLAYYVGDRVSGDQALQYTIIISIITVIGPFVFYVLALILIRAGCAGLIMMYSALLMYLGFYVSMLFKVLYAIASVHARIANRY